VKKSRVATLGVFDGVHRGHRALLETLGAEARAARARPFAYTFDPPPAVHFGRLARGHQLTPLPERIALLEAHGAERVVVIPFASGLARLEPEAFVARHLLPPGDLAGLVIGYDYRFGAGARGDAALLARIGRREGFWVREVGAVEVGGAPVSSTRIRRLLGAGEVAAAATLLGRPYRLAGVVIPGRGIGRRALVPTANFHPPAEQLLPADGIYVVGVRIGAGAGGSGSPALWGGVCNLGLAPTISTSGNRLVETHLLDYDGDLVGATLQICFLERLRDERRFADLDALRRAIDEDIARARGVLGARGENRLAACKDAW